MAYCYEIAGLKLKIEGDWNDFAQKKAKAYEAYFEGAEDIYVEIRLGIDKIDYPKGEVVLSGKQRHWLKNEDGGAFYDFVPEISEEIINCVTFDEKFKTIKMELCKSEVLGLSVDERPFNLMDRVMRLAALEHNRLVLHASGIIFEDNAILFSAPSGTGKSTHTSLWKQYYPQTIVFNDDAPMISFENGEIIAWGTPWSGTSGVNLNKGAKLNSVIFLEQAKECSIKKTEGTDAIFRMFQEISKPVYPKLMQSMLDKMSLVLTDVPAYVLSCDISENAVETVKSELGL